MAFTATPTDGSTPPIPMSSVIPDATNTPVPLEGGPIINTGGNNLAPASMYVKDGNDVAQGAQADVVWSGSGAGSVVAILKKIVAGQAGAASVVQSTGAPQGTSWRVAGDSTEVSGLVAGALNADLLAAMDVSAYKSATLMLSGTWAGTLTIQGSNDNFVNQTYNIVSTRLDGVGVPAAIATSNVPLLIPIVYRYLRIRMTAYTSGTANGVVELYTSTLTLPPPVQVVQPSNSVNTTPWLMSVGPPVDLTLIASAAFTTTQTTADLANFAGSGIRVVLDVTVAGTGSVTLEIDAKDVASGKYVALLTGVAVTTISTNVYVIHPALTAATNAIAKDVLPHTWRVRVTANNANSVTYSVGASYLN